MSTWAGLEGLLELRAGLHGWVRTADRIHAAVAFGSTEREDRPADLRSDLDLLFVVEDVTPWLDDLAWVDAIRPSWLSFVNDAPIPGIQVVQVLFTGGYDADLIPVDRDALAALGVPEVAARVLRSWCSARLRSCRRLRRPSRQQGHLPGYDPIRGPTTY